MKSHQLFKIYRRFDKEIEKNTHTVANGEKKSEKSWTLFYNRLFYKAIKNGNRFSSICFFVNVSLFCKLDFSATFAFCYQDDARNVKIGN